MSSIVAASSTERLKDEIASASEQNQPAPALDAPAPDEFDPFAEALNLDNPAKPSPTPIKTPAPDTEPPQRRNPGDPAPAPTPTPDPSLSPEEQKIREIVQTHGRWMAPKVRVPRRIASPEAGGAQAIVYGQYGGEHRVRFEQRPTQVMAIVNYEIEWFVDNTSQGKQSIEARYAWNGSDWDLLGAARCLERKNEQGQMMYMLDPREIEWAGSLFHENPFY